MQISVFILLTFVLQMPRKCQGIKECLEESDPMGAKYRGTTSKTENGRECQKWDSDEFHHRYEIAPNDLDNNYCRNPYPDEESSLKPWCYTTDPEVAWEYCSISTCKNADIVHGITVIKQKGCANAVVTADHDPVDSPRDSGKWARVDFGSDLNGFAISASTPTSTWEVSAAAKLSRSSSSGGTPEERGCKQDIIPHASSASPEVKIASYFLLEKVRFIWLDLIPGCTYSIDSCY